MHLVGRHLQVKHLLLKLTETQKDGLDTINPQIPPPKSLLIFNINDFTILDNSVLYSSAPESA